MRLKLFIIMRCDSEFLYLVVGLVLTIGVAGRSTMAVADKLALEEESASSVN